MIKTFFKQERVHCHAPCDTAFCYNLSLYFHCIVLTSSVHRTCIHTCIFRYSTEAHQVPTQNILSVL